VKLFFTLLTHYFSTWLAQYVIDNIEPVYNSCVQECDQLRATTADKHRVASDLQRNNDRLRIQVKDLNQQVNATVMLHFIFHLPFTSLLVACFININ
jgi:hypothetical protein